MIAPSPPLPAHLSAPSPFFSRSKHKHSSLLAPRLRISAKGAVETLKDVQYKPTGTAFDLQAFVLAKAESVNAALNAALPLRQPFNIHKAMRYSLLSEGKRVCPILCICSCELMGGSQELAMPTACALEMVHAASLIHDDLPCMDDDDLRRGQLATHRVFGEDLALLSGDALYAYAVEHVAATTRGVPGDRVLKVIAELGKAVGSEGMVAGQFLDLLNRSSTDIDIRKLEEMHLRRIGALAECSLTCGAILGGAEEEEIERLRQYGRTLGLLYQVVDDVLNSRKTSEEYVRKPQKHTFAKYLGVEKCKELVEELSYRAKENVVNFENKEAIPLLCFVDFLADLI